MVCSSLALRMLKFGYPSRVKYDVISEKYAAHLVPTPVNLNHRNFCEAILGILHFNSVQLSLCWLLTVVHVSF